MDMIGQDDEINNQSQLVEKLREQVVDVEELMMSHRKEAESLQAEQQRVQAENDSAKDEARWLIVSLFSTNSVMCIILQRSGERLELSGITHKHA